jgi:hypothetical protein
MYINLIFFELFFLSQKKYSLIKIKIELNLIISLNSFQKINYFH